MSMGGSGTLLRDIAQRTLGDWLVGSAGVGAALLSAGFATYMIAVGPGDPNPRGSGHFGVFAQFDRRPRFAQVADDAPPTAPTPVATPKVAVLETPPSAEIDFAPTGSIGAPKDDAHRPAAKKTGPLQDFVLRDVFDGKALVEGRHRLSLVSPGTVLEGAGTVLSIEQQSGRWVVVTDGGMIETRGR